MCWMCDHPHATRGDYLEHLGDLVASFGWAVQSVGRDGAHPPWAYTVGLTAIGRPELVVTGLSAARACRLLNDVASHVLHAGICLTPGERIPLIGGPPIEVVGLTATTRLVNAVAVHGTGIRGLQLIHADDRGHWPWEVGYRGCQPILGTREAPPASAA